MGETNEFLIAIGEIRLIIIRARNQGCLTIRAALIRQGLSPLPGPSALRTLHPALNTIQQLSEGNLEQDCLIDMHTSGFQRLLQKLCLGQTTRKPVEHPPPCLEVEPFCDNSAHQVIWKILSPCEDGLGKLANIRLVFHLLTQQCASAQITELQSSRQPPALRALARCRRPEQENSKLAGSGGRQWILL